MEFNIYVTLFNDKIITIKHGCYDLEQAMVYCMDLIKNGVWQKGDDESLILHKPKSIRLKKAQP